MPYSALEHVQVERVQKGRAPVYVVPSYLSHLTITICVTIWVARTLHRNGRVFLTDAFHGNAPLADSVNHLLVVGFYLINVGYATMSLATRDDIPTPRAAIEFVSHKAGFILLVLGAMHFFNLYVFHRLRLRGLAPFTPPPLPPDRRVSPVLGGVRA
jgi:hypothetical protein